MSLNYTEYNTDLKSFYSDFKNDEYHLWEDLKLKKSSIKQKEELIEELIERGIMLELYIFEMGSKNYLMNSFDFLFKDLKKIENPEIYDIPIRIVAYQENYDKLKKKLKLNDFLSIREKNKLKIRIEKEIELKKLEKEYKDFLETCKKSTSKIFKLLDFMERIKNENY